MQGKSVWKDVIPLEEMRKTREYYKALDLMPHEIIIVVGEVTGILFKEIKDLNI